MEYYGRHTEAVRRETGAYDDRKPQLPSFEHFVRETGHPDLTFRGPPKLETIFGSPPSRSYAFGFPSLAATPATNGVHNATGSKSQQDINFEYQSAILEEHELPQIDPHRRASLALPLTTHCQPRPSRAYSSTNVSAPQRDVLSWQHGRVIHEENIPGKGPCYVYDDGTICPKEVNGDAVNPKWGTTKAGKPRKRLGQACNTCREKKIKCDPGFPKCSQCLRFNRECRFDANSRQGHKSPKFRASNESPGGPGAHSPKEYITSRKSSTTPTEVSTPTDAVHRTLSRSSNSAEDVLSPTMLERQIHDAPTPSKRQRLDGAERKDDVDHTESSNGDPTSSEARRLGFAPEVDPINANEKLTRHYVDIFLDYINVANFEVLPRRQFVEWVTTNLNKSSHDRIMLYAVLAWGTTFSEHPDRSDHRAIFMAVIYQELDRLEGMPCLQLVHALLYLSFAEFVHGQFLKGCNIFARCVGVLSLLQMNVELSSDDGNTAYGLLPATYAECRRRTYWAAFCTDTYLIFNRDNPRMLHSFDEIFLRLPCANELFERDEIPQLPVFDGNNLVPRNLTREDHLAMANMVYLIQITAICAQVKKHIWRCRNSFRVGGQRTSDQAERDRLNASLRDWADGYNEAIQAREGKTKDSEHPRRSHGESGAARARKFAGLDFLFHYAHMELNRRVFHRSLPEAEIVSHAKTAIVHAIETLKLTQQILDKGGSGTRDYTFVTKAGVAIYAIYAAIDIITAGGKTADVVDSHSGLMALMYSGLEVLDDLKPRLKSSQLQQLQVKERIQIVFSSARAAVSERKIYFFCSNPAIAAADRDFDVIYGTDRLVFLRMAYSPNPNNPIKDGEVCEIHTKDTGVGVPGAPGYQS